MVVIVGSGMARGICGRILLAVTRRDFISFKFAAEEGCRCTNRPRGARLWWRSCYGQCRLKVRFCPNDKGWRIHSISRLFCNRLPIVTIVFSRESRASFAGGQWWTVRSGGLGRKLAGKLILNMGGHGWVFGRGTIESWYRPIILARELRETRACNLIKEILRTPAGSNPLVRCIFRSSQAPALLFSLDPLLKSLNILITAIRSFCLIPLFVPGFSSLTLIARGARQARPRHLVCETGIPD